MKQRMEMQGFGILLFQEAVLSFPLAAALGSSITQTSQRVGCRTNIHPLSVQLILCGSRQFLLH